MKASKPFTIRHLVIAILTCVVMLGLAELIAQKIHSVVWYPSSYDYPRNLFFRRGWEYFTEPQDKPTDDYLVIIISNSQAFLAEHPDARQTYAYLLEQHLEDKMQNPVTVLNWAVVSGNAAEQIILAARAIGHHPDMVLWIAHNDNLSRAQNRPFTYYATDIPRLVYQPEVRQYLSDDFLSAHAGYDPLEWLNANTGIGKLTHVFERDRSSKWWWKIRVARFVARRYVWNEESVDYAREFYETLQQSVQPIPMAFVSMPLNDDLYDDSAWAELIALPDNMNEAFQEIGADVPIYDATTLIDGDLFYSTTHIYPEGHRQFAEWLVETVEFPE